MCVTWTGPNGFSANSMGSVGAGPADVVIYNATADNAGTYSVTAYDCFGSACIGTDQVNVNVVSPKIGRFNSIDIIAYPIPAHDNLTVEFNSSTTSSYELKIMDMIGKVMKSEIKESQKGINFVNLDLSDFAKGVYILFITSPEKKYAMRIVLD